MKILLHFSCIGFKTIKFKNNTTIHQNKKKQKKKQKKQTNKQTNKQTAHNLL